MPLAMFISKCTEDNIWSSIWLLPFVPLQAKFKHQERRSKGARSFFFCQTIPENMVESEYFFVQKTTTFPRISEYSLFKEMMLKQSHCYCCQLDSENLFLRYELERLRSICQQQKVGKFKYSILSYTKLSRTRTLPSLLCCWVWGTTIMISKSTLWFFLADHWSSRKCDFCMIPYFIFLIYCFVTVWVMHDA